MIYPIRFLIVFVSVCLYSMNVSADTYLCIPEKSTGFFYTKSLKKWDYAKFTVEDKYLITKITPKDVSEDILGHLKGHQYQVKFFGEEGWLSRCKDDFTEYGFLECHGDRLFRFNNKNLRYVRSSTYGYTNSNHVPDRPDETSAMPIFHEIGTCSKL